MAHVSADPNRLLVSGQGLASAAVGKPAYFTISNVTGTVEDVEVNVEGEHRFFPDFLNIEFGLML